MGIDNQPQDKNPVPPKQEQRQLQVGQHVIEKTSKEIRDLLKRKLELDKNLAEIERKIRLFESSCADLTGIRRAYGGDTTSGGPQKHRKEARLSREDEVNASAPDGRGNVESGSSGTEKTGYDTSETGARQTLHVRQPRSPTDRLSSSDDQSVCSSVAPHL